MSAEPSGAAQAGARSALHARLLHDPGHLLALGFGAGLAPVAPGTWGSLVGVAAAWFTHELPLSVRLAGVLVLFLVGVPLCQRTAAALGDGDPGAVVLDEIVAVMLTLTFCSHTIIGTLTGFLAFRFFDVVKPWPVRFAERRVGGGLGIMLDDILAAGYAIIFVKIIEYFS